MSTQSNTLQKKGARIRTLVQIAMLSAISAVLMVIEIPLGFAPNFYKIDLSEVPVLIGCFALGPVAGIIIELIKVLLSFALNGTITMGVGEFANFLIGCSFVVPAGLIYRKLKTRKGALIGMIVGILFMTVLGCLLNAFVLLPAYATAFHMPIDQLVEMGTAVNGNITNLTTFVLFAVAPFNLLKGVIVTIITLTIYKKISPVLKKNH